MRPRDIQTIDELFERKFKTHAYTEMATKMRGTVFEEAPDSPVFMTEINQTVSLVDLLADGSNNAFITDTEELNFIEKSLKGSKKFTRLQETILTDHLGLEFPSVGIFTQIFDRIISRLQESGISDMLIKSEATWNFHEPDDEKVKLSLDHMGIWLYAWGFLLICASVVFSVEVVTHKICSKSKKSSNSQRKPKKPRNFQKSKTNSDVSNGKSSSKFLRPLKKSDKTAKKGMKLDKVITLQNCRKPTIHLQTLQEIN
jgi:hypothetical protein